ncbi:serine hydrolase domain-containing protein [Brevundimonas halotolerans]|uniref:CubicO group peptidase (Beta-lactamase class C family) n=1 Tax=Brevundimonas halotolerans TaxID=69670 RepID=A0A7W9A4I8_9CAUL|nr:serine hydrolase domain-containing protein [Brevundimonas halotolerans]MBB5661097.1 CubicO group peptidase (beta-lactamase class C family) [Brevundimonas halotolerans]
MRFIWALLAIGLAAAAPARMSAEPIDAFIATELPISGAPGIAYAVVEGGEIVSGARGEVLIGSGRPVTPDTPFLIGSISKSFTAMAVMQLVEAGTVDLNAPVSQYLDVFKGRPSGAITLRQLLSHTSGFSTRQGNDIDFDRSPGGDELQRQVARIAQWRPAHAPDARWQYSNANYQILGAVIEAVSGQDYASYVEARILEPIGMEDSFVSVGARHDSMAVGHQPWFGSKRPFRDNRTNRANASAGGVVSTASDMALYLATMMNGRDDVINVQSKTAMLRPASTASPYYGFGWSIDANTGDAYHSGLTPGIETLAVLSPAEGRAVIILVNANSGMGFGENVGLFSGVSARAFGRDGEDDGDRWGPKSLFLTFALLPVLFVIGAIVAWFRRSGLRAKSGVFGTFSLWFPLLMTLALAWVSVWLIPQMFGVSIGTLALYSPDLALLLAATAVTGVLWAVFRLGVFYSGKASPGRPTAA